MERLPRKIEVLWCSFQKRAWRVGVEVGRLASRQWRIYKRSRSLPPNHCYLEQESFKKGEGLRSKEEGSRSLAIQGWYIESWGWKIGSRRCRPWEMRSQNWGNGTIVSQAELKECAPRARHWIPRMRHCVLGAQHCVQRLWSMRTCLVASGVATVGKNVTAVEECYFHCKLAFHGRRLVSPACSFAITRCRLRTRPWRIAFTAIWHCSHSMKVWMLRL